MLHNDRVTRHELPEHRMLGDRLDRMERRLSALERTSDACCQAIEHRIDVTQAQTENVQAHLAAGIDASHRDLTRIVLLGLLGIAVSTTGLYLATIILIT